MHWLGDRKGIQFEKYSAPTVDRNSHFEELSLAVNCRKIAWIHKDQKY